MALGHSPSIVTNGLVLCLDAGNTKSYPGSGTTWSDLSGNGITGTLQTPTFSATKNGCLVFNGTADYVSTPTVFNNTAGTWECWFNPSILTGDGAYGRRLMHQSNAGGNNEVNFTHISGNLQWLGYGTSYVWQLTCTGGVSLSNWYSVVGTYDGSTAALYLNGVLSSSVAQTGPVGTATGGLYIGRVGFTNVGRFGGSISQVKVYNRALTATEVAQNFNALRGRFGV